MRRSGSNPIPARISGILAVIAWILAAVSGAHAQQPAQPAAENQEQRLQQIEEQLLDLNGIVGTLQSLVGQGAIANQQQEGAVPMVAPQAASPQPGAVSGDLGQRVDVIETQIRALSGQLEQISGQLAQIQAAVSGAQVQPQETAPAAQPAPQRQGQLQQPAAPAPAPAQNPTFGTLTVAPDQPAQQQQQQQQAALQRQAAVPQDANTRAAYDTAYNYLLQRDFKSAEAKFRDFVEAYPDDPLAGNAQYWLGETYYVRGAFREAADAFLAGYRKYRGNDKAPANLLKLGMSLHQLGEKDSACATFSELSSKFPDAPGHLKQRAASERQRAGC